MRCPECGSLQIKNIETVSSTCHSSREYIANLVNLDIVTLRKKRCLNPDCMNDFWTEEIIKERPPAIRKPGGQPKLIRTL